MPGKVFPVKEIDGIFPQLDVFHYHNSSSARVICSLTMCKFLCALYSNSQVCMKRPALSNSICHVITFRPVVGAAYFAIVYVLCCHVGEGDRKNVQGKGKGPIGYPLYSCLRACSYTTGSAASIRRYNYLSCGDFLRVHVVDIPANGRLLNATIWRSSRGLSWDMP